MLRFREIGHSVGGAVVPFGAGQTAERSLRGSFLAVFHRIFLHTFENALDEMRGVVP